MIWRVFNVCLLPECWISSNFIYQFPGVVQEQSEKNVMTHQCIYHIFFSLLFKGAGTSGDPCSENYRGTRPFSEAETAAISNKMLQLKDRIVLYMTLHSYGQYWLTPWGYTFEVPEDYNDMVSWSSYDSITQYRTSNVFLFPILFQLFHFNRINLQLLKMYESLSMSGTFVLIRVHSGRFLNLGIHLSKMTSNCFLFWLIW